MISCSLYDHIEIACLYKYPIQLTLKSGEVIECKALDTQYNDAKQECIKVEANGIKELIILDTISKLEVTIDNPYFKFVNFD